MAVAVQVHALQVSLAEHAKMQELKSAILCAVLVASPLQSAAKHALCTLRAAEDGYKSIQMQQVSNSQTCYHTGDA